MTTPSSDHDWLAHPRAMKSEIYDHLGFDITDGGEGWVEVTLRITPVLMNADGVVHGGIWLVVADSAMGGALLALDHRAHGAAVTSQSDFRWLRPLQGETLRAVGRVLRRGRQVWHTTVECFDDGGQLVGNWWVPVVARSWSSIDSDATFTSRELRVGIPPRRVMARGGACRDREQAG